MALLLFGKFISVLSHFGLWPFCCRCLTDGIVCALSIGRPALLKQDHTCSPARCLGQDKVWLCFGGIAATVDTLLLKCCEYNGFDRGSLSLRIRQSCTFPYNHTNLTFFYNFLRYSFHGCSIMLLKCPFLVIFNFSLDQ